MLYVLIAVSAWMVWTRSREAARPALTAWGVQIVLNALWSWLFFGLERPGIAFVEIVALWLAILTTIVFFRRHRPLAAWLLAPYLAWVSFAAVLNFFLWRMNVPS